MQAGITGCAYSQLVMLMTVVILVEFVFFLGWPSPLLKSLLATNIVDMRCNMSLELHSRSPVQKGSNFSIGSTQIALERISANDAVEQLQYHEICFRTWKLRHHYINKLDNRNLQKALILRIFYTDL
jgi:hypothetical protein